MICYSRLNEVLSEEIEVKIGVHQGLVLSALLFITVLEAMSLTGLVFLGSCSMQMTWY